jgi:hypothetical protein
MPERSAKVSTDNPAAKRDARKYSPASTRECSSKQLGHMLWPSEAAAGRSIQAPHFGQD